MSRGSVIDVFCGAGILTQGFYMEGFQIAGGLDIDSSCRFPFEHNNQAPFLDKDVSEVSGEQLGTLFEKGEPRILIGCAPCQPFSKHNRNSDDSRWLLLKELSRLIHEIHPDVVSMENVPELVWFKKGTLFKSLLRQLRDDGYLVSWGVLNCLNFGVPQARKRLVLLASRHGLPELPDETHSDGGFRSVYGTIGNLPEIKAGESDTTDPLHKSRSLAAINLRRIRASVPGGSWNDWDSDLLPNCYRKTSGEKYTNVYGRMRWDGVSPTITTQFLNYGSGRYGHPVQDRAISIREGARLQTIPDSFVLSHDEEAITFEAMGRMIGNAVPLQLSRAIARTVKRHLVQ